MTETREERQKRITARLKHKRSNNKTPMIRWRRQGGSGLDTSEHMIPPSPALLSREESGQMIHAQRKNVFTRTNPKRIQSVKLVPKNAEDTDFCLTTLKNNFLFSKLSKKETYAMVDSMTQETREEGETILEQGRSDDAKCYLLQHGRVYYFIDDQQVGSGFPGCSFGEMSLLYNNPRSASVVAAEPSIMWKIDQRTFRYVLARKNLKESMGFIDLVKKIPLFSSLDSTTLQKFADAADAVFFKEGDRIVDKEHLGDTFYVIQTGYVKVHDIGAGDAQFVNQVLKSGDWFSESDLVTGDSKPANVTAMTPVELYCMPRKTFESSIGNIKLIMQRESNIQLLKSIPPLANSDFNDIEIGSLARVMNKRRVTYLKGDDLKIHDHQCLWILIDGKIRLTTVSNNGEKVQHELKQGDFFGAEWIKMTMDELKQCEDDVECLEDTRCFRLFKEDFDQAIGHISRLGVTLPYINPHLLKEEITMENLQKHSVLGQGQFGTVYLTSDIKTGKSYALKAINKLQLLEDAQTDMVTNVIREKELMGTMSHPFICALHGAFQDAKKLYFLLPLIQGGELFNRIYYCGDDNGLPNNEAVFYGACVIDALGHMHKKQVCFRDLKPENVLLGKDGYCVVVDFGFAKIVEDKTYTLCGTPEYLAPEIILAKGHNTAADYWSFGCMLFEMIEGVTPFYYDGITREDMTRMALNADFVFSEKASTQAKDLIEKLLVTDPAVRLGNLANGFKDIEEHFFFLEIDFGKLVSKELTPPFIPVIENDLDNAHYSNCIPEDYDAIHLYRDLSEKEQELFQSF